MLTGLAPVMGAVTTADPALAKLSVFFVAGILLHMFGFILNEVADREVDRLHPDLAGKPLVSGEISPRFAVGVAIGCAVLGYVLIAFVAAPGTAAGTITLAALFLVGFYDLTSKRLPFADWALGLTMSLAVIAGAVAVGNPSPLAAVVAGLMGLQLVLQNTLAHIKDLRQDAAAGGVNAALLLGTRWEGGRVHVSAAFRAYLVLLRAIHLMLAAAGVLLLPGTTGWAWIAWAVTQSIGVRSFLTLAVRPPSERSRFLEALFRHEFFTLFAVTILLLGQTGPWGLVPFVVFPVGWGLASVRFLHGGRMPAL